MLTNQQKIQHLYWRAGFGIPPKEWQKKLQKPIKGEVEKLLQKAKKASFLSKEEYLKLVPKDKKIGKEERRRLKKLGQKAVRDMNLAWLERMADIHENPLLERMTLFWHGHFACTIKDPLIATQYLNDIRANALGNFKDLVVAIAKSPAMIRFLNNQQNRKRKPNENFAREVMELFTIGRDNYTEKDIKEAARAFTGWSSNRRGDYVFRAKQHDFGTKTFMGETGDFNGEEIIDIILKNRQTANYITTKIYRYFVNDTIDKRRVEKLANQFYDSNYDIAQLMKTIFTSDWFYDPKNVGTKIKSPIDVWAGMMQVLDINFDSNKSIIFLQRALGQVLFNPPNVAGWAGGKAWIDNATLMLRLNLVGFVFKEADVDFRVKAEFEAAERNNRMKKLQLTADIQPLIKEFKQHDSEELFTQLSTYLLQCPTSIKENMLDGFVIKNNKEDYIKTLALRLMSLPEYQMC